LHDDYDRRDDYFQFAADTIAFCDRSAGCLRFAAAPIIAPRHATLRQRLRRVMRFATRRYAQLTRCSAKSARDDKQRRGAAKSAVRDAARYAQRADAKALCRHYAYARFMQKRVPL
jgi:hypothetical protein